MKFKSCNVKFDGKFLKIEVPNFAWGDAEVLSHIDGLKEVELNLYKSKRGMSANALMWLALRYLAEKFDTTKEELYMKYLRENGIFQYYLIKPEALETAKKAFRIVDVEGKDGEMLKIKAYTGTSVYDTKEFSYFLSRIIEDAEEEGFSCSYDIGEFVKKEKKNEINL